jgi:exodeoxyribonuclease VIII
MIQDVMVDLETLGTTGGCIFVSIGAVEFDGTPLALSKGVPELGREFYSVLSISSQKELGMHHSADTVAWWKKQSPDAQRVLQECSAPDAPSITQALATFADYLHPCGKQVRIWGNGSDFDNPIIAEGYRRAGLIPPWQFWNSRCFRTLKNLLPGDEPVRGGTHHNALDDAKHQARWALVLLQRLYRLRGDFQ